MVLKTPLSHLTNNMTFTIELERIEGLAAEIVLAREEEPDWPERQAQGDATVLTLLVKSLVDDLHRLNKLRRDPQDLCPRCAGYTWGRPSAADGMDFTKRQCHRCNTVRPEPEEG